MADRCLVGQAAISGAVPGPASTGTGGLPPGPRRPRRPRASAVARSQQETFCVPGWATDDVGARHCRGRALTSFEVAEPFDQLSSVTSADQAVLSVAPRTRMSPPTAGRPVVVAPPPNTWSLTGAGR